MAATRLGFVLALALISFLAPEHVLGWPAHVNADRNEGQAFLFNRGEGCFGIVPTHVLADQNYALLTVPPITEMVAPKSAQGDLCYTWNELDLSVLKISGLSRAECGSVFAAAAPVRDLAQPNAVGVLLRANRNGSRTSKQVVVTFIGASSVALIRAARNDDALRQGDSGSTIYLQNLPAAVLQTVSSETGEGSIVGFSDIATQLEEADEGCAWSTPARTNSRAEPELNQSVGWFVSAWSHPPTGPDSRPENLLLTERTGGFWTANLGNDRKAWVEFQRPSGEAARVNSVEIGLPPAPTELWPTDVEVFTCSNLEGACVPVVSTRRRENIYLALIGGQREAVRVRIEFFISEAQSKLGVGRVTIR